MSGPAPTTDERGPTRLQRRVVAAALVLLLVPGLIGFDAWPLTAWRLFSLGRTDRQTRWVVETVDDDGAVAPFSLEQLPMRYRNAEWPMADLGHASDHRREQVCQALLDAVRADRHPAVGLDIVRDRQHLVRRHHRWVILHDRQVIHTCRAGAPT